jgi:hypothetical protein
MARFRLKTAHVMMHTSYSTEVVLEGDKEAIDAGKGEEKGTIVGDGTPYKVVSATLEMEPLDDEARVMIDEEIDRLSKLQGSMQPLELLAKQFGAPVDDFEKRFLPGFPGTPRPQAPTAKP